MIFGVLPPSPVSSSGGSILDLVVTTARASRAARGQVRCEQLSRFIDDCAHGLTIGLRVAFQCAYAGAPNTLTFDSTNVNVEA